MTLIRFIRLLFNINRIITIHFYLMLNRPIQFTLLYLFALLASCSNKEQPLNSKQKQETSFVLYAKEIKDSFQIAVQLPLSYATDSVQQTYPVVFVTDADLYFPMLAPIMHQHEQVGLLPPLILVGIGYGSIMKMDSLRTRDYLYPAAIASDEIEAAGGGLKYYDFIGTELLPKLEADYRVSKQHLLLGHSFGGNFALLAMQEQRRRKEHLFDAFVAASPALWYNNFYFAAQEGKLPKGNTPVELFLTVGGKEDKEWNITPVERYAETIRAIKSNAVQVSMLTYPEMGHMETALVSMLQGITKQLTPEEEE